MHRKRISLLAGLMVAAQSQATINLSNLSAAQREGTRLVDIHYDVDNTAGSAAAVSIIVSNGSTQVSSINLGNISEGTGLLAVWDGAAELNGILSSNLTITVQASEPIPEGMVRIPAGTNIGSDSTGYYYLTVDSFLMDATETTKAEWDAIATVTANITPAGGSGKAANHPVQDVSWQEAVRYCNGRSAQEGLTACYDLFTWACNFNANGYRLPTEDEWEYAARGGFSGYEYPWGDEIDHTNANYYSTYYDEHHPDYSSGGYPYTSPVGSFESNDYGLYDMAGNVWEWCNDSSGTKKISKGGSWDSWEFELRCGHSAIALPTESGGILGFRTVRNAGAAVALTETIVFDSRDYTLTVDSAHGSPVPMVGTTVFDWKEAVACSVEQAVFERGTNYTCIGWIGTGSVPLAGDSNLVQVVLDEPASSIVWNWATDDMDNDGMDDDWEIAFFGNLGQAATNDFDLDLQDNLSEYIAGTNPTNAASLFKLTTGEAGPDRFVVEWPPAQGRTYNVYWTPNLVYTGFQPLETNIAFPRNSATGNLSAAQGFYKVDVRN